MKFLLISLLFLLIPVQVSQEGVAGNIVKAQQILADASCTRADKDGKAIGGTDPKNNEYSVCDIIKTGLNIGAVVLYFIGSVVLLAIIVGSFYWVTSGGSAERVATGKRIIGAAFTGLFITLVAYELVGLVFSTLLPGGKVTDAEAPNIKIEQDKKQFNFGWWDFNTILRNQCVCPKGSTKKSGKLWVDHTDLPIIKK